MRGHPALAPPALLARGRPETAAYINLAGKELGTSPEGDPSWPAAPPALLACGCMGWRSCGRPQLALPGPAWPGCQVQPRIATTAAGPALLACAYASLALDSGPEGRPCGPYPTFLAWRFSIGDRLGEYPGAGCGRGAGAA
jgi:hypothetical protein